MRPWGGDWLPDEISHWRRQGSDTARTGLVAACLLLTKGIDVDTALQQITEVRGVVVPESPDQLIWIRRFAERVALPGLSKGENVDALPREMIEKL